MKQPRATPNADSLQDVLDYYAQPTPMTEAGKHADALERLPSDVGKLAEIIQGLAVHEYMGEAYGFKMPEARKADDDALLVADGFSCRTQVEELTGRRPLHLAETVLLALRFGRKGPATNRPEDAVPPHDWLT